MAIALLLLLPDWEFQQKPSNAGKTGEKSKRIAPKATIEDSNHQQLTLCLELNPQTTEKQFFTQELVAEVKKTTSIHRLTISYLNILAAKCRVCDQHCDASWQLTRASTLLEQLISYDSYVNCIPPLNPCP
jgi:hypothetical protein